MQIALFRSSTIISKIIQFVTRSPYSHASLILKDGTTVEAREFKGVRRMPSLISSMRVGETVDVFDFVITKEQEEVVEEFLSRQIGKGYDYWMVLGFITHATREERKSYGKWFCSELIYAALEKAGIFLLKNIQPWLVAPASIGWSPILTFNQSVKKD